MIPITSTELQNFNRNIIVNDNTDYTGDSRLNYGIALFVNVDPGSGTFTNDPTLSDMTNPGDDSIPGEWTITVPRETKVYEICLFYCQLWISGTWAQDDIVYYNGDFWKKNAVGTGTDTPSGISTEWDVMAGTNYAEFLATLSLGTPTVQESIQYVPVEACKEFILVKKACNGQHCIMLNVDDTTSDLRYTITTYTGESEIAATEFEPDADTACFTLTDDNVYIISIERYNGSEWEEVFTEPIYEYCKLKTCATYLFDSVLCNEFDPCCDNCDEDTVNKQSRQRLMLNQLIALYGTLMAYINEESIDYLNIVTVDEDRLTYIERIGQYMDKVKAILERCELCSGAWQSTTDTTTNNGSYKPCNC